MICPQCSSEMQNLGNINNTVYTSNPVQWDDTYVCHRCKVRINKREHGALPPNYSWVDEYKKLGNISDGR